MKLVWLLVAIILTSGSLFWSGCSSDGDRGNPPPPPDGALIRRVTTNPSVDGGPTVSPDGKWIAFYSERAGTGQYRLWRIPFAGGAEEQLTTEHATSPRYSPDGIHLYFSSNRSGDFALYRMPSTGGAATLIPGIGSRAELSPDGQWFVWSAPDPGDFDRHIWKRRSDLSEAAVKLTTAVEDNTPTWSPAGDKIVFRRGDPNSTNVHLYVMNADGSGLQPLTAITKDVEDSFPAWSPNGEWIVFDRGSYLHEERIFKVRATGETTSEPAIQLTFNPVIDNDDSYPRWSPDGKWIVFDSERSNNHDVYVISSVGEPQEQTSRGSTGILSP